MYIFCYVYIILPVSCMCYVDLIGNGDNFFSLAVNVKMHVQYSWYFYVYVDVELYVVISEKKIIEYEHGYVYITKHKYFIRRCCLLCETLVEHPTSGASKVRPVGSNNNISDWSEA